MSEGLLRGVYTLSTSNVLAMTTCRVPSKCMAGVIARAFSEAISPLSSRKFGCGCAATGSLQ
ncbi:MAG: hypothetical protein L3J18_08855 [Candidatus Brocadia sp.]|nr:MAG: hypothetical protein L3J18_08855 [Candidatus Brocadia sp.]